MWSRWDKGPGQWCAENDGAYQAEMAAIHGKAAITQDPRGCDTGSRIATVSDGEEIEDEERKT